MRCILCLVERTHSDAGEKIEEAKLANYLIRKSRSHDYKVFNPENKITENCIKRKILCPRSSNNPPRNANIINWHKIIRLRAIKNVKREIFFFYFISSRFARCIFLLSARRRRSKSLVIYKGRAREAGWRRDRWDLLKYFSLNIVELFFVSYILKTSRFSSVLRNVHK